MHKQHFISNNSNCFKKPHLTCYPFIRKLSNLSKFHFNNFLSKLLWNDPILSLLLIFLSNFLGDIVGYKYPNNSVFDIG